MEISGLLLSQFLIGWLCFSSVRLASAAETMDAQRSSVEMCRELNSYFR